MDCVFWLEILKCFQFHSENYELAFFFFFGEHMSNSFMVLMSNSSIERRQMRFAVITMR